MLFPLHLPHMHLLYMVACIFFYWERLKNDAHLKIVGSIFTLECLIFEDKFWVLECPTFQDGGSTIHPSTYESPTHTPAKGTKSTSSKVARPIGWLTKRVIRRTWHGFSAYQCIFEAHKFTEFTEDVCARNKQNSALYLSTYHLSLAIPNSIHDFPLVWRTYKYKDSGWRCASRY